MSRSAPATMTSARHPAALWRRALQSIAHRETEVRDTLWLLGTILWIAVPHFEFLPLWCSIVFVAMLGWRLWLTWSGRRLPARWLMLTLTFAATFAVFVEFRTVFGKEAGVALLLLLLGLKLLEMRAHRDTLIVIFLCLFIVLTAFMESQSIFMALYALAAVLLLVTALVNANHVGSGPSYRSRLVQAGRICLSALPMMLALYLLFPRVDGPLWGMPKDAFSGRTGLSDSMSPGTITSLGESDELAFRVRFAGRIPAPAERYWRGPVFGSYDGRTWRAATRSSLLWRPPSGVVTNPDSAIDYTITLEAQYQPWVLALEVPEKAPELLGSSTWLRSDLMISAPAMLRERVRYTVRSFTDFRYGLDEDPKYLEEWLRLPPGYNPRTLQFAVQLRNEESDPRRLIDRVLHHIRTENFVYTLNPPPLGRDAVDEFLFDTRRGFCEHYASAFVVLMRALDIPSRVVTGYQGGELNPVGGFMEVRQRDAHAWAEVWLPDRGWMRVDPTAAVAPHRIEWGVGRALAGEQGFADRLFGLDAPLWRQLRFNWDALKDTWDQWIIGYTSSQQRGLFSDFGIPDIDWHGLAIALLAVLGAMLGVLGLQLLRRRPKRDALGRLYFKLCAQLGKTGIRRAPHEGSSAYLSRVLPVLPEHQQPTARQAMQLYELLRYGRPPDRSRELLRQFQACLDSLRS